MAKQQQQEQQRPPGALDALYPAPLSPEARKNAQARLAEQQARRMAELQAMEQAKAEREARRQADAQKFQEFAAQAAARREAFANGEIAPAQAASIPRLEQYWTEKRPAEIAAQQQTAAEIAASPYAMQPWRRAKNARGVEDAMEKLVNGPASE